MMPTEDAIERALREGPPYEERYVPTLRPIDDAGPHDAVVSQRVRPVGRGVRNGALISLGRAATAAIAAILIVGSFLLGRSVAPSSGSAAPPSEPPLLQAAVVPYAINQTYIRDVSSGSPLWMICPPQAGPDCRSAVPTTLPKSDWPFQNPPLAQGFPAPATFWGQLRVVTVKRDHLIVATNLTPITGLDARLLPLDGGSVGPAALPVVSADPGIWFFDLGTPSPGRYVLGAFVDGGTFFPPTFLAIGLVVQ